MAARRNRYTIGDNAKGRLGPPKKRINMVKLSVMYPNGDGASFNMDYYCSKHMPLVRQSLGTALKGSSVDEGVGQPGLPAPFVAMCHLLFDSIAELQSALKTHGPKLMADIPNYTNTRPTIQISEIKM
jgi:uncharacterized protein (TIGR02118 family)